MILHRAKRQARNFTIIGNDLLRDPDLSYRARGVLACILSYPDEYRIDSMTLARAGGEGRDAIRTALSELESAGYLVRERSNDPVTGRWVSRITVYDERQLPVDDPDSVLSAMADKQPEDDLGWGQFTGASPAPENPAQVEPAPENPAPGFPTPDNQALKEGLAKEDYNNNNNAGASAPVGGEGESEGEAPPAKPKKAKAPPAVVWDGEKLHVTPTYLEGLGRAYPNTVPAEVIAGAELYLLTATKVYSNHAAFLQNSFKRAEADGKLLAKAQPRLNMPRGGGRRAPAAENFGSKDYGESGKL